MSSIEIINQDYVLSVENTEHVIEVKSFSISDYKNLDGKPSINNVLLQGNVSNVDLGLPLATDLHLKEDVANKIVQLGISATNIEYPSAKCVYDNLELKSNKDLSNLSTEGQAVIDAKANKDLSNLSTAGQAVISAKANIAADNFSTTGKALLSSLGMPSTRYDTLTLGASGSTYTAPANGYLLLSKNTGTSVEFIVLSNGNNGYIARNTHGGTAYPITVSIPVLKNQTITYTYNASGTLDKFRFYYAEGN